MRNFLFLAVVALLCAAYAHGDDRCKQGYVWREAFAGDHVCVTPQVRQQAADDNRQAASRLDPARPGFCRQGFVWREARPSDHVCVTPETRAQAAADNHVAADRVAGPPKPAGGGTDVSVEWRPASNGAVPPHAVLGGWEKYGSQPGSTAVRTEGPLYICRAPYNGAVYTGKIVKDACNFGAEGREHRAASYEVMVSRSSRDSLGWRQSGATPPPGALTGGRSPAGRNVFICRIPYNGGIHPGWQVPARNACSIGFGGQEVQRPGMSYLVAEKGHAID